MNRSLNKAVSDVPKQSKVDPMTSNPPDSDEFFRAADLVNIVERYMEPDEIQRVYAAFHLAADAHKHDIRKSGEPYITHPVEVARILADMHLDVDTVSAALLHDVVEDTHYTLADIEQHFGSVVSYLVDGVTKLKSNKFSDKHAATVASFQKMMQAMTEDFRVVIIKLADRLHNLRTLTYQKPESRRRIARETLSIYVPLARRMGMNALRREIQLLAFQHLHPWRFRVLEGVIQRYLEASREINEQILNNVTLHLQQAIPASRVLIPDKNLVRVYESIKRYDKKFDETREMLDLKVLVGTVDECYRALGVIHSLYRPRIGQFHDFIATPKSYGFQALQTIVMTHSKRQVRVQIQTRPMYQVALYGIAAQWRYPGQNAGQRSLFTREALVRWQGQVRDLGANAGSAIEFYSDMQADLFLTEIFAFTPRGDVKEFPRGATMIDFAFAIHTDVGLHCIGARLDGGEVPLRTHIPNGATIEIMRHEEAHPQPSWLNYAVTSKARSHIRTWLRQQKKADQRALGKALLQKALQDRASSFEQISDDRIDALLRTLNMQHQDELFLAIAQNEQCSRLLAQRLLGLQKPIADEKDTPLLVRGTSGLMVHFQPCCYPLPNEPILAVLNPEQGLKVHRDRCRVLHEHTQSSEVLSVAWAGSTEGQTFLAGIQTQAHHVVGVLHHVTELMHQLNVNIESVHTSGDRRIKDTNWVLWVRNLEHLEEIMHHIEHIPSIIRVKRLLDSGNEGKTAL
ncbi:MAG: hypothetical protein CR991_00130 [Proteobacteria bacterium]|nr:MAG: hypothetical protein CR991_00130 [Pseudomonadota bacterium]